MKLLNGTKIFFEKNAVSVMFTNKDFPVQPTDLPRPFRFPIRGSKEKDDEEILRLILGALPFVFQLRTEICQDKVIECRLARFPLISPDESFSILLWPREGTIYVDLEGSGVLRMGRVRVYPNEGLIAETADRFLRLDLRFECRHYLYTSKMMMPRGFNEEITQNLCSHSH